MLQDFVESLPPVELPIDPKHFSAKKRLYDYQIRALVNIHRLLHYFYREIEEDKEKLWDEYVRRGFNKEWEGSSEILRFHFRGEDISYRNFVNRACFWMATGSGKTLVIVKLIELLDSMMRAGIIPRRDILFLTQREDLVESFKRHVEEYNLRAGRKILLEELKNFHRRKANPESFDRDNILVFYYRADLISDRRGEKILHYENYHNEGNWYLILDEAHKGDAEESKRRQIFNVFTKRGFMFNFSATFTDEFDRASTVFRFNLADFIRGVYGKHILVMETQTEALGKRADYTPEEKRRILAKMLILTGFLRKIRDYRYPSPLAVVLVNTVNTKDADLRLFFSELFSIAEEGLEGDVFEELKRELLRELSTIPFWFEEDGLRAEEVNGIISFSLEDLYLHFFSAPGPSKVEIIHHPENRQEIVFRLKNAEEPFAVVRIGDITDWLRSLSNGVEIRELIERESFFLNIDNKESVSLLAGSRSFYEGWDSPRPNVIAYINIGSRDAQKFLLQSLGRGVRVKITDDHGEHRRRRNLVRPLETLYVFATSRREVLSVINETLKEEQVDENKKSSKALQRAPDTKLRDRSKHSPSHVEREEVKALMSNIKSEAVRFLLLKEV